MTSRQVVTCSDDSTWRTWRIKTEEKNDNEEVEIQGKAQLVPLMSTRLPKLETTPRARFCRYRNGSITPNSEVTPGKWTFLRARRTFNLLKLIVTYLYLRTHKFVTKNL